MSIHDAHPKTPGPAFPDPVDPIRRRFRVSGDPSPRWLRGLGAVGLLALITSVGVPSPASASSPLLEQVKQNPQIARNLCGELRELNKQGVTSTSPQAVSLVARRQGLNATDAEILTTYVVGLHCPDVR